MRSRPRSRKEGAGLPPFARVVEEHGPALLRFCAAAAGAARAEDCFQETMLAALRAYEELRDAGAVRSWLFAIAARKAIDGHRDAARAPEPVADVEARAATPPPSAAEAVWRRVAALPDKQRRAVTLRYRGDLSHRDIARAMGITEAAARRNVFEGLARLKRALDGASGGPHEAPRPAVRRT